MGRIGIICPNCGQKLRVQQGRVRATVLSLLASLVGWVYFAALLSRRDIIQIDGYIVGLVFAVGFAAMLVGLPRLAPRLARLRAVESGEAVLFPLQSKLPEASI
jgi:hypothetical protein